MKPLIASSILAPGYYGVNTQDSPVDMDKSYCLEGNNCVIDKNGRLGARKGWVALTTANAQLGTSNVAAIGELIQTNGTSTILAAGNSNLFTFTSTTLTTLTYGGGGSAPTISANNWKIVTLNNIAYFFQAGHDPLVYAPLVSTTTYRRVTEVSGYVATVPQANVALSAFGRLWVADISGDKSKLYWSDILTGQVWSGGTSGSLDLSQVWPNGGDNIVALAAHNDFLIIFGKTQILIYSNAKDPAEMRLNDNITGIGCIARDSVVNTGEDVVFMSNSGVRSLLRTIQEKSSPTRSLSRNIFDEIQVYSSINTASEMKAVYSQKEAFYLLAMPTTSTTFCFDMRSPLQDGSARATVWNNIAPKAIFESSDGTVYIGQAGTLAKYSGYLDNASQYRVTYYSPWLDFANPVSITILKKILGTIFAYPEQQIVFSWGFDYETARYSQSIRVPGDRASLGEYALGEYNIAEYNNGQFNFPLSVNGSGNGRVVQVGFETQINGYPVAFQRIDVFAKEGRI